jgi:SAM-dependent methyltransferase
MNWKLLRGLAWIDTRAQFVDKLPKNGSLLDLGSSDGGTLTHINELRPDLHLASSDIAGSPENYPSGTDFRQANFDTDKLPWADRTFDAVTCMHVVEHLKDPARIIREAARVLKSGGRLYVETPHPRSVDLPSARGSGTEHVTVNFYDDKTHTRPVPHDELEEAFASAGFQAIQSGTSRNLIIAAAYPLLVAARPRTRARYVSQLHFTGWSIYTQGMRK